MIEEDCPDVEAGEERVVGRLSEGEVEEEGEEVWHAELRARLQAPQVDRHEETQEVGEAVDVATTASLLWLVSPTVTESQNTT